MSLVLLLLLQEARFDRHFVRDLTWTRHQLEELAERRFRSAQRAKANSLVGPAGLNGAQQKAKNGGGGSGSATESISFQELFNHVKAEDFSSYLSKISTPRELMIMMTEVLSRIESKPDGSLTAQVRRQESSRDASYFPPLPPSLSRRERL